MIIVACVRYNERVSLGFRNHLIEISTLMAGLFSTDIGRPIFVRSKRNDIPSYFKSSMLFIKEREYVI